MFYALVLQIPVLLEMGGGEAVPALGWGPWGDPVARWAGEHPMLAAVLTAVLIGIQGLQASTLANRHRYTRSLSQLAGLGVVLVWGLVPGARVLHPLLLANTFLLFALLAISTTYKNPYPQLALFNCGAWVAVASLFVPGYLLFLLVFLVAAGVLNRTGLAALLRLLVGVLVIYFLLGTLAYATETFPAMARSILPRFNLATSSVAPLLWVPIIVLGLLTALCTLYSGRIVQFINIEGSKGVSILYYLLLMSGPMVLFVGGFTAANLALLIVPLGILTGLVLNSLEGKVPELLHLLLLVTGLLVAASGFLIE